VEKGCYWSVGNGENINVWKDNWIQQKGNSHTWSTIAPNTEHLKVKDLMLDNYNEWNAILINQLFLPFEAQKILNIPIIDKTQNDTLTWDGTTDGNYTVKDGYQAISKWKENANIDSASTSGHNNELWEMIWKLKVPPKHISFGEFYMMPYRSRLNCFKRALDVIPSAQNAIITMKLSIMCSWSVTGLRKFGSCPLLQST
jgi:hypothetical protein